MTSADTGARASALGDHAQGCRPLARALQAAAQPLRPAPPHRALHQARTASHATGPCAAMCRDSVPGLAPWGTPGGNLRQLAARRGSAAAPAARRSARGSACRAPLGALNLCGLPQRLPAHATAALADTHTPHRASGPYPRAYPRVRAVRTSWCQRKWQHECEKHAHLPGAPRAPAAPRPHVTHSCRRSPSSLRSPQPLKPYGSTRPPPAVPFPALRGSAKLYP